MTQSGSSPAVTVAPDDATASNSDPHPADAGEDTPPASDDRPGSVASPIEPADLEDLPGLGRTDDDALDIGEVFELLKNQRRRRVIRFLKAEPDGTTTLDVLAENIAALENDIEVAQLSSRQRKRVYIGLYQCHLPKLDDFGVVEFRKNRGIIHLKDTSMLDPYLPEPAGDTDDAGESAAVEADDAGTDTAVLDSAIPAARSTPTAEIGVAVVALVGATGLGPLAAVPAAAWTLVAVAALLWSAAT